MIKRSQIFCGRAKRIDGNLILGTVVLSGIIPRSFPGPFMDVKYVLEHACPAKWFHGLRSVLKKHVQAKAWVSESGLHKIQIMTVLPKDSLICFSIQGLGSSRQIKTLNFTWAVSPSEPCRGARRQTEQKQAARLDLHSCFVYHRRKTWLASSWFAKQRGTNQKAFAWVGAD